MSVAGGLSSVVYAEFGHDGAHVGIGGLGPDAQGGADFSVAVADGKQFEHVALALCEAMGSGISPCGCAKASE